MSLAKTFVLSSLFKQGKFFRHVDSTEKSVEVAYKALVDANVVEILDKDDGVRSLESDRTSGKGGTLMS